MPSAVPSLTDEERFAIYAMGETLIPPALGEMSADEAGFAGHFLDAYLALRSDHADRLRHVAAGFDEDTDAEAYLRTMQTEDPPTFEFLTFVVVGSYFLNQRVRDSYGYRGQVGESQDGTTQSEYEAGGILDQVRARGPIYRDVTP